MRDWWSSGARLSLKSGSAAVAFDIHLEDVGVVHEAVDGGERHSGVTKYAAPLTDRAVRGNQD